MGAAAAGEAAVTIVPVTAMVGAMVVAEHAATVVTPAAAAAGVAVAAIHVPAIAPLIAVADALVTVRGAVPVARMHRNEQGGEDND